jgi:hypothetical protein
LVLAAGLLACSSGGGGTPTVDKNTITGTAAAGAPIAGIVNVKGANGETATADIGTDGKFSLDVTGLTAPYILYAEGMVGGKSVRLYSSGVATGTINITPVTDFIVRQALAGDAETAYTDWDGTQVTADSLAAAETAVQEQLQPVLDATGVASGVDLVTTPFNADSTGVDQALDCLDITYDAAGTTATVTNDLTGSTYTDDVTDATDDASAGLPASDANDTTAALTDGEAIAAVWDSLTALYATTPASADIEAWLTANLSADHLDGGYDRAASINSWAVEGDGPQQGMTFSTAVTEAIDPASYTRAYWINVTLATASRSESFETQMVFDGTDWLWHGDQHWVEFYPGAMAGMYIDSQGTTAFATGFHLSAGDDSSYAYNNGVRSAVITGPGLPDTGVVLNHDFPQTRLSPYNAGSSFYRIADDAAIANIPDNAEYTIELCSEAAADLAADPATCSALQTYAYTIAKRPLANSELSAADFAAITAPTGHALADANIGGTLDVAWTLPAGSIVEHVGLSVGNNNTSLEFGEHPMDATTSATLDTSTFTDTATYANLKIDTFDMYRRSFEVDWEFSGGGGGGGGTTSTFTLAIDGGTSNIYTTTNSASDLHMMVVVHFTDGVTVMGVNLNYDDVTQTYSDVITVTIDGDAAGTYTIGQTGPNGVQHIAMYAAPDDTYYGGTGGTVTINGSGNRLTGDYNISVVGALSQASKTISGSFDIEVTEAGTAYTPVL